MGSTERESCLWVWCPTYPSCCLWHFGSWQPFVTLLGREIYNGARLSPSMTLITILRNYVTPIAKHSAFGEGPLSILFGSVLPCSPGWAHNISVSTFPWPGDYRHMATTLQGKWWFLNLYEMWFISRPVRCKYCQNLLVALYSSPKAFPTSTWNGRSDLLFKKLDKYFGDKWHLTMRKG